MKAAIADILVITIILGTICAGIYFAGKFVIAQFFDSTPKLRDYAYSMTVKDPDGRDMGQIRINGELTPKVRNGFYLRDIENDMILDVRNDGSIRYYPGKN